ncbi:hypothetical protein BFW01_g12119 [Lasiodiplodia theobromae]|nr:hypothetical protein BFW01_g12119 [Lasiodiplodia theobromae]
MSPPNNRIDLFAGWPAPSLLPVSLLKDAAVTALSDPNVFFPGLGYGPDEGYEPLRKNIAKWMTEFYLPAEPVSLKHICITGGASQNIACILQVYTDPAVARCVWMVEPAYYLARRIFEDAGFGDGRIRGIPGGDDAELGGIDLAYLENAMEDVERQWHQKIYSHVIYCVPTFSNPSGVTMPKATRRALVRLARKYDILVLCDDVYDFLSANPGNDEATSLLPRIVDIDKALDGGPHDSFGNVVSNGSFSKIAGPGCRVGWAEGTEKFIYGLSQA